MVNQDEPFEMQTPAQWKAFSHPLRLRILQALADQSQTNEELAAALGEQSGKLYFHTKKLLDAGLIVLDSTRQKGPITEKLYRAVARRFTASPPVKGGKTPPFEQCVIAGLELYQSAWAQTGGLPGQIEGGFHLVVPLDAKRRAEFVGRLHALADDFKAAGSAVSDAKVIALTVLMHAVEMQKDDKKEEK